MRLGLNVGYWGAGMRGNTELVEEADRLGYHSVWAAEAYGADVVSVLAWFGARTERIKLGSGIMQMPARTPAMTAMTAATLDELSGGRFLLGLGLSGPQVVEGWHGVPYGKPLGKTREYVSIVRTALHRTGPLVHDGEHYQIPYRGEAATGLGKPLKLILHPDNPDLPIYLASIGPKNVQLTAEIADGWLPVFYSPEKAADVFAEHLAAGFARSEDSGKADRFDIAPSISAVVTDDLESGRNMVKPFMALYIGGLGARGKNFYFDLACRYGYEHPLCPGRACRRNQPRRAASSDTGPARRLAGIRGDDLADLDHGHRYGSHDGRTGSLGAHGSRPGSHCRRLPVAPVFHRAGSGVRSPGARGPRHGRRGPGSLSEGSSICRRPRS